MGRFDGRVALVTGGGRGIGRATALALAAEGARVAVSARTAAQCEQTARDAGPTARDAGPTARWFTGDVTDPDSCRATLDAVRNELGRVELLIHAAGISPFRGRAENHSPDVFQQIVDVNLAGAFNVLHAAAPQLLDGGGCVVLVSSTLGQTGSERLAAYGASKAGLTHLARTLGREWASRGVRVNAVCAGYVPTAMTDRMLAVERVHDELLQDIPMGRLAEVGEIVAPILFLASDDASYVTGTALVADGGIAA